MTGLRALAACTGKHDPARDLRTPLWTGSVKSLRMSRGSGSARAYRAPVAPPVCASVLLKHLRASSSSSCCCATCALTYAVLVQMPVLNEGIRNFYDKSSGLWERMWGEHMHHGYYDPRSAVKVSKEQAQLDMIDNVLEFAGVSTAERMVDVGCGIGGSSRCAAQCNPQ